MMLAREDRTCISKIEMVFFAPTDDGRPPYTFLRPPLPPWPPDNDIFCFSLNRSKMSLSALLSLLAVMVFRLSHFSHPEPTPALFTQYPSMKMFHITPIYPCTYTNIPQCIISENLILTTASRQATPTGFQSSITSLNISQSPVIPLFSPLRFPTHTRYENGFFANWHFTFIFIAEYFPIFGHAPFFSLNAPNAFTN